MRFEGRLIELEMLLPKNFHSPSMSAVCSCLRLRPRRIPFRDSNVLYSRVELRVANNLLNGLKIEMPESRKSINSLDWTLSSISVLLFASHLSWHDFIATFVESY